jgi:hypothetical protein
MVAMIETPFLRRERGFLFLVEGDILKAVKYRQNIEGVKDEENNMSVYWIINVDRMFDKTHYNIKWEIGYESDSTYIQ